ncbi:mannose-1-phosphate guanylyltransferase [Flavobacterium oreochromis]|uniref:Mannose-1-phosphate guanylyltransferase n=1 Tax=Flavobacterium columnare TaxID=996 RepID=A0A246GDX9_9FLAO|nr:mannose-1-phosphate guanylyltransferase [Flavobacterium oreochromis]OWP79595.1 mannose-1-phosphate guanylyltransferase [Flavobacterium oreochromis]QYS86615.1 mannose-1-phosphate guanylyltransferase [Flavobacterium oreochromis]
MNKISTVILSGGIGSRLWPLSRKSVPKQYLPLFNNKNLFSLTIDRNISITNKFILVGNESNVELGSNEFTNLGIDFLKITETLPKNTAAAIAFSAFASNLDDILLVVPSDHIIVDVENYHKSVNHAITLAEQGNIVTFGIIPTKPETGFGYIESDGENVISFREKPNKETAISFLNAKKFFWNSGMFCFKVSVLLDELLKFEPKIFEASKFAWDNSIDGILQTSYMENIISKSIDYAVMERSNKIKVVLGDFGWSDLGSFESLYEYFANNGNEPDENGNMYIGFKDKFFQFLGLQNTILVETEDANLILRKENSQEVKNIYEKLEKIDSPLIK